jgi:hypothetical protein
MNKGYNKFTRQKITKFRRPPQVKSSKAQIYTKCHKIPEIRFEDQQLTSLSGVIIFQLLFGRLKLKLTFRTPPYQDLRNFLGIVMKEYGIPQA